MLAKMEMAFFYYYGELFSFWVHIVLNFSIFKFCFISEKLQGLSKWSFSAKNICIMTLWPQTI